MSRIKLSERYDLHAIFSKFSAWPRRVKFRMAMRLVLGISQEKRMKRIFLGIVALGLIVIAIARVEVGRRRNPSSVTLGGHRFGVEHIDESGYEGFIFTDAADGKEKGSVGGENHVCDPAFIYLFDMDGDGDEDLYYSGCNGAGIVRYDPAGDGVELHRIVNNSDWPPGAFSWWFGEWLSGGWTVTSVGLGIALVGLLGLPLARRRAAAD